mmetsp:Transcript_41600/g.102678  ORF Transcript_41600/g.102678 Transcript_41600/m.102678 type:complete len:241 (-) Transcript_41600:3334-4056(-)
MPPDCAECDRVALHGAASWRDESREEQAPHSLAGVLQPRDRLSVPAVLLLGEQEQVVPHARGGGRAQAHRQGAHQSIRQPDSYAARRKRAGASGCLGEPASGQWQLEGRAQPVRARARQDAGADLPRRVAPGHAQARRGHLCRRQRAHRADTRHVRLLHHAPHVPAQAPARRQLNPLPPQWQQDLAQVPWQGTQVPGPRRPPRPRQVVYRGLSDCGAVPLGEQRRGGVGRPAGKDPLRLH